MRITFKSKLYGKRWWRWKQVRYGKKSPYNTKSWKYNGKKIKL